MVFPILGANTESAAYEISNSLRFNDGDSAYLSRTPSSASNRRTWTWSAWVKVSTGNAHDHVMFSGGVGLGASGNRTHFRFLSGESEKVMVSSGNTSQFALKTSASLRDRSAWYHFVLAMDTTQSTDSNRFKMYINGSQVTDTAQLTYPDQNLELGMNSNEAHHIGLNTNSNDNPFDGYMADINFIDGTAYAPTAFGETNNNGVWVPIEPDVTYGTNGYKLEFKQTGTSQNSSGIGADTSGNDNHYAVNNLAATDVTTDTPTNNFCTFNPIFTGQRGTFSEGNTKLVTSVQGSVNYGQSVIGTFLLTSGKWYWEIEVDAVGSGGNVGIGVNERIDAGIYTNGHNNLGSTGTAFYKSDGNIQIGGGSNISNTSYTSGDIISVALDLDNSRIYWAKNGVYQSNGSGTGNPSTGANPVTLTSSYDDGWVVFCSKDDTNNNATFIANFGNYPVAVSSGNADANGYGNFEYAVPSGFYSLCTKNLAEFG
jgi:hypothetical protein